jgi:hypothetical protein
VAWPGDELAAAGGSHMRASHADRERVIYILKVAFVQGRLTKDEFDLRTGRTLASRTYGELAMITADLPVGLILTRLPSLQRPAQAPPHVNKPLMWGMIAATIGGLVSMASSFPSNLFPLLAGGVFIVLIAAPVAGTLMMDSWRASRSGGSPPPPWAPAPGQVGQGGPDGGEGNGCAASAVGGDVTAHPRPERDLVGRALWPRTRTPRIGQIQPEGLVGLMAPSPSS